MHATWPPFLSHFSFIILIKFGHAYKLRRPFNVNFLAPCWCPPLKSKSTSHHIVPFARAHVCVCVIKTIRELIWTSPGRNIKSFLTRSWHCMLKAYRSQSTIKTGEFVTHLLTKDERLQSRFLLEPFKSNTVHHVRICDDVHMAVLIWYYTPSWCLCKQMATSHVEIPNQMSHMVRSAELEYPHRAHFSRSFQSDCEKVSQETVTAPWGEPDKSCQILIVSFRTLPLFTWILPYSHTTFVSAPYPLSHQPSPLPDTFQLDSLPSATWIQSPQPVNFLIHYLSHINFNTNLPSNL